MPRKKDNRIDIVYSTNPDFEFKHEDEDQHDELPSSKQVLHVMIDKKQRAGKEVTLVTNFKGSAEELEKLGKMLKAKCGVGGSVKNGEIIVQGNFRDRVMDLLQKEGYQTKRVGG